MKTDTAQRAQLFVVAQFLLIAIFAAVFFLDRSPFAALPVAIGWLGLVLCGAGLLIGAAALAAMGRVMQVSPQPKANGRLITGSVYRYLRHPMYTGILLIVVGLFMRKPSVLVALAGLTLFVLLILKAAFEERLLAARYDGYEEYRKKTWGVIPGVR